MNRYFQRRNGHQSRQQGRFALPIKYRQEITASCQNQLVITIDTQARCLLIYPLPVALYTRKVTIVAQF